MSSVQDGACSTVRKKQKRTAEYMFSSVVVLLDSLFKKEKGKKGTVFPCPWSRHVIEIPAPTAVAIVYNIELVFAAQTVSPGER